MDRTERQKLCIKHWVEAKCCASIVACTGFGKTRMACDAIKLFLRNKPNGKVLIVVPSEVLKEQWKNDYIIPQHLDSNCTIEIINTTIRKTSQYDFMVLDEAHKAGAEQLSKVFETVQCKFLLCLTGTLERLDGRHAIITKYAPICDTITIQEAETNGWVSPVKQYVVMLDVDLTDYNRANKKFNSYFAFFNWKFDVFMKVLQDWKFRNTYAKTMGVNPKNAMAMAADCMRALQERKKFIATHPHKIEVCKQILEARKDKKCITFSSTIEEAKKIGKGYLVHSQQKKKENAEVIEKFNNDTCGVIRSSRALNEGVDVKGLSVGIVMNVDSSKITSVQKQGRCIRYEPGKQAEMFILILRGTQEEKWFNNSNTTDYTVIDEIQLQDVLNGLDLTTRPRESVTNVNFRF